MRIVLILLPFLAVAAPQDDPAGRLFSAIHKNDLAAVKSALKGGAGPDVRDDMGATPLMHAAAYASENCMLTLIQAGAAVNAVSDSGSTALMWAVTEPAKVRLLLRNGADPKIETRDKRTAFLIARQTGSTETVALLRNASDPSADGMDAKSRPLIDNGAGTILTLRSVGADPMVFGRMPLYAATFAGSVPATRQVLDQKADPNELGQFVTLKIPPISIAANFGNTDLVRLLLERGANPNAVGSRGLTPLMCAAAADTGTPALIQLLLDKGAGINARDEEGRTALDWALYMGETPVVKQLRAAGARSSYMFRLPSPVAQSRTSRAAVEKAIPVLQPISPGFFNKTSCISCHNQSLVAIAVRHASSRGVAVNSALASHPTRATMAMWRPMRESLAQGTSSIGGIVANVSYGLHALAEESFVPNEVTDAAALALARLQLPDGSWVIPDSRPPLGGTPVVWTALAARGLRLYLPAGQRAAGEQRIRRARAYLIDARLSDTQDQAFALLGLNWSGAPAASSAKLRAALLAGQREDGGWAQKTSMSSDAYATGQALYALRVAGKLAISDPVYQRGVNFLLRNQLEDGSWFVRSRAIAFQPYMETGFPHEKNQFISAAATSWAVIALSAAI